LQLKKCKEILFKHKAKLQIIQKKTLEVIKKIIENLMMIDLVMEEIFFHVLVEFREFFLRPEIFLV